ncbi:hypothetical protein [Methanoregula sp.]|uniref:hypothetical protein n=1 Tax=Methanoregula sp. TaxID=2052170 RepID=UPI003568CD55
MKWTKKIILGIIHQKERKESSGIIAKIQHITRRRVDQLWRQYRSTGVIPIIGESISRPKKPVTADESVIDEAYRRFRYGASMLEKLIRKAYVLIFFITAYTGI